MTPWCSDPFTGWLGPVVLPGVASNSYYPIQATAAGTAPGTVQDATPVLSAQPQQSQVHQSQISYDRLGFPVIASQLTPSDLHGRSQLSSGPQGSSSLEQTQYLPSRALAAITQSQYSLSPGYINPDNQELLPACYSPSQGGVSLPYDPIHDAFNRMLAEVNHPGLATGTQGYSNVGPGGPSSTSQALSSALVQASVTDQMPLPRTPSRAAGPPPCRSIIVENVPRDMEHAAIIGSVPVSDIARPNMTSELTSHSKDNTLPLKVFPFGMFTPLAVSVSFSPIFVMPSAPILRLATLIPSGTSDMPPSAKLCAAVSLVDPWTFQAKRMASL